MSGAAKGNVIVVAGAGTGKTYTLVERCFAGVLEGCDIDEMLIVTFTKAAAAELRHRISQKLQDEFAKDTNSPHLARQIAKLDRARISTLHSFCLDLVCAHFSELGLTPRLTTLEGAEAAVMRHEALERLLETYYDATSGPAAQTRRMLIEWFRGDDRAARDIVQKLHDFTQTRPDPAKWFAAQRARLAQDDPTHWREWHTQAIEDWAKRWRAEVEAQNREAKNPAREVLLSLIDKFDVGAVCDVFENQALWPRGSVGKHKDPLRKMCEEAQVLAGWLRRGRSDPLLEDWGLAHEPTLRLLDMADEFARVFGEMKSERGFVDFHDLEQFSLRLLWNGEGPSEVAKAWRKKLKWIFVDEYQDINAAQDRIIQAIAREGEASNRFLVGDVKQSIYGFRQAEPKIFLQYEERWSGGAGGTCERLVSNWRSHERILDFVNKLFAGLMSGEVGEVLYDEKTRLVFAEHPDRVNLSRAHDPGIKVEVHLIEKQTEPVEGENGEESTVESKDLADFNRAEAEAELIAHLCCEMVEKKRLTLPNGLAATYGDIVILLRSAASEVEAFAKVFSKRGIPLDARRTGFFSCMEVLDLLNLLTVLDNPLQDLPLLGLLRSPIGCFSPEELAEVRMGRKGLFWEALRRCGEGGDGPTEKKAREFLAKIGRWRRLSRHTSLAQRLETILEETGYEDWIAAQDRGEQRRANIRRVVDLARQFDAAHGQGLYPFLQYVEDQTKAIGDVAPAPVNSRGAVRLMTAHQSKGLQFPIVIMAGLSKPFNKEDIRGIELLDQEFGLCLKVRPPKTRRQYETLPFWMARHRRHKQMLDEEMRILYVALTRAENRLLLVGAPAKNAREQWSNPTKRATAAKCMLDWIGPWLAGDCAGFLDASRGEATDWIWQWHSRITTNVRAPSQQPAADISSEALAKVKERIEWQYEFAPATQQEAKSSATSLRRALADEPELAAPVMRPPRRAKDSIAANEVGQATHRLMQHARFEAFDTVDELAKEVAELEQKEILKSTEAAAIDVSKVLSFWKSDFGRELLSVRDRLQREVEFTAKFSPADLQAVGAPLKAEFGQDEFVVVQGAADLLAVLAEELWLVDFKTDRIPEQLIAARVQEHALQLRIYALALSRIYRKPVTRACLHFLELNRTEPVAL